MKITKPGAGTVFTINAVPEWPNMVFETDRSGAHTWLWTVTWGTFQNAGSATTAGNQWDAKEVMTGLGGKLVVVAKAGSDSATLTVTLKGTNPTSAQVTSYLASKPNNAVLEKIIRQESSFKHFTGAGEPVKSFDNGYGMCQLTTPAPTFEQVWNWRRNVDAGLSLYEKKRAAAIAHLGQSGRKYTEEQVKYEAVCRWNGGSYHQWNAATSKWVRPTTILCDSKTGNIGWDMTDPENKGKTEAELHQRDSRSYSNPPGPGAHWKYYGVCYADHVLD